MNRQTLNIIHLPHGEGHAEHRQKRWDNLMLQVEHQKISDYSIWPGIKTTPAKIGISRAHKAIVREAKQKGLEYCISGEDDICFYGSGAWQYYLDNIPADFDIYLGSYHSTTPNANNIVKKFSSTTLIMCHSRFYDTFLGVSENIHLDNVLSMTNGKFVVCNPMVAYQMAGFSENVNKEMDYQYLFNNKPKYKCSS